MSQQRSPRSQPLPSIPPVRKTVTVPWPPAEAFDHFTKGIASWWPVRTHSVGQEKVKEVVLEAREGGKLFEVQEDGTTSQWGTILACEVPSRLLFTWHPGRDADSSQQVEVTFTGSGGGTEVVLLHTGWEALGERALETRNGYDSGWEGVLRCYVQGTPAALDS